MWSLITFRCLFSRQFCHRITCCFPNKLVELSRDLHCDNGFRKILVLILLKSKEIELSSYLFEVSLDKKRYGIETQIDLDNQWINSNFTLILYVQW